MKADDTTIRVFLEGSKQFIVPLFQRTYSWETERIQTLWEDIENVKNRDNATHFFGAFVTMPIPSSASGVSKYVIIDGQQRLVTVFVLLAALRNRITEIQPDYEKKDEITELYLVNKYHPEDSCKLLPTQADKHIFLEIIGGSIAKDNEHLLTEAYDFIQSNLALIDDLGEIDKLKNAILLKLCIVDIRLDPTDDPYLIFESLNAKSTPLTQADLIRNYLFMRIDQNRQQTIYDKIWFPMQQKLGDQLEHFIRHYMAMDGDIPNFNRIYGTFKESTDKKSECQEDVVGMMRELLKFSDHYHKFLHPENEREKESRKYLEKLARLVVTTSYPLLLKLYDDYVTKAISLYQLSECLRAIEVYIVRRAVCGLSTQALNKYFPIIYKSLDRGDIVRSLRRRLKNGVGARRMPDDDEFLRCLRERELYGNRISKYILEEIEKHDNKEIVDFAGLQIEHIMPKGLNDDWKRDLGSNWQLVHQKYLDTLGNLTLTGYNPEYSNKSFVEKRDMEKGFRDSGLKLNRVLSKCKIWSEEEMEARAVELSEVALKIWSF